MADETALKDGNRNPTLLFEKDGEVRRVSNTNPLPVAGVIGTGDPVPVTGTVSLPPDPTLTETREQTGPIASLTVVTPAAGKRLLIKGMLVIVENASGYDAGFRMAGGKTLHKIFRSDQQAVYVVANYLGAANEALTIFGNGMGSGVRCFYLVNYQEVA